MTASNTTIGKAPLPNGYESGQLKSIHISTMQPDEEQPEPYLKIEISYHPNVSAFLRLSDMNDTILVMLNSLIEHRRHLDPNCKPVDLDEPTYDALFILLNDLAAIHTGIEDQQEHTWDKVFSTLTAILGLKETK